LSSCSVYLLTQGPYLGSVDDFILVDEALVNLAKEAAAVGGFGDSKVRDPCAALHVGIAEGNR
jgi:hypothetical protein